MNLIKIGDINDPEMEIYSGTTERQLRNQGLFIAESAYVIIRALEAGYEPVSMLVETERLDIEAKPVFEAIEKLYGKERLDAVPVYVAERDVVINMTGHHLVRGLWMVLRRKAEISLADFCKDKRRIAVLTDVANPANVGAIFRSAAALGMDGVLLTHASVDPLTRRSARAAMGTVFQIPWVRLPLERSGGEEVIRLLHSQGYKTVAMALTDDSVAVDSDDIRSNEKLAVLLGTEGTGLPQEVIEESDYRVMIPMYRGVDSLNVAAASAICFWELMK